MRVNVSALCVPSKGFGARKIGPVRARDAKRLATAQRALSALKNEKNELARLALIREARDALDGLETSFVEGARVAGETWADIGAVYGTSKQGAQQRFRRD